MSPLGGWAGYGVSRWHREPRGGQRWLVIELDPQEGVRRCCDLPVFEESVELRVQRLRLACPRCGPRLEQLDWLDRHARVTRRLARSVARLCAVTSVRHAAQWHGLDWKTAKAIDYRYL